MLSGGITNELLMDRIKELMRVERDLETTKEELEASAVRGNQLWAKCIRWETIYDREIKKLRAAQLELRRFQTICKERTNVEKQRVTALAMSCRTQQRELENIAAALFDAKPSPSSAQRN